MAFFSKSTLFFIFRIFVAYCCVSLTIVALLGPSYLLTPSITDYNVSGDTDNDNNDIWTQTTKSHDVIRVIQSFTRNDTAVNSRRRNDHDHEGDAWDAKDDRWIATHINASYESVQDEQELEFRCDVCAVVTNSGQLLGSKAGEEIDGSDCVLRMNAAPTRGYEADVGTRTDVRIIGHSNLIKDGIKHSRTLRDELFSTDVEGSSSITLIPWLYRKALNKTSDRSYLMAVKLSQQYPDMDFYVSTPAWVAQSEALFKAETGITRAEAKTWLSTGWMTILFAIESCETVNVYGMVPEKHCMGNNTDVPYHYYANGITDTRECNYYVKSETNLRSGHKLMTEKAVFARWATRCDLNFYYPTWENISAANPSTQLDTLFLRLYKDEPLRRRLIRRQKMLNIREQFKRRKAVKRVKIRHRHSPTFKKAQSFRNRKVNNNS